MRNRTREGSRIPSKWNSRSDNELREANARRLKQFLNSDSSRGNSSPDSEELELLYVRNMVEFIQLLVNENSTDEDFGRTGKVPDHRHPQNGLDPLDELGDSGWRL